MFPFNECDACQAEYDRLHNSVFKRFLKVSSDVDGITVSDGLFQTRTAGTGKARSPIEIVTSVHNKEKILPAICLILIGTSQLL